MGNCVVYTFCLGKDFEKKMLGYWGFPLFKFYNMQTEN